MQQYLDLMARVRDTGVAKTDRTGTGTLSVFGHQMRFDLGDGFPLVTTKKLHVKSIIHELIWFLAGDTNIAYLNEQRRAHLGRVGGRERRPRPRLRPAVALVGGAKGRRPVFDRTGRTIDQIAEVVETLKTNPDSRRMIVSAWNPADLPDMALAPCHCLFQFYVADGRLSCQLYQRSADVFLGVPFNIASYALLTMMMAQVTGLEPGEFVHTFGDAHLYLNHLEQADEQLKRTPRALPRMEINPEVTSIFELQIRGLQAARLRPPSRTSPPPSRSEGRSRMIISLVVAIAENGVIGRDGGLPWHLSSDLKTFRRVTMGKPVIMGRKTFQSLKKPLDGRDNIVVSRDESFRARRRHRRARLRSGARARRATVREARGVGEIMVIGGTDVFKEALPLARFIYKTEVHGAARGRRRTFRPSIGRAWEELARDAAAQGPARRVCGDVRAAWSASGLTRRSARRLGLNAASSATNVSSAFALKGRPGL